MTEQGEMISAKFADPERARQNLEALVSAAVESAVLRRYDTDHVDPQFERIADELSASSQVAYRPPGVRDARVRGLVPGDHTDRRAVDDEDRFETCIRTNSHHIEDLRRSRGCSAGASAG
jgi:hypothetical protein